MVVDGSTVTCRNCGASCVWKQLPSGKFWLHDGNVPHNCKQSEDEIILKEYSTEPIVRSDIDLLAKQVGRLAYAIEELIAYLKNSSKS